jgi:hypothetical protein
MMHGGRCPSNTEDAFADRPHGVWDSERDSERAILAASASVLKLGFYGAGPHG